MIEYVDMLPLIGVTSFAFSSLCLNHIFKQPELAFLRYNPDPVYAPWYLMSSFDSGGLSFDNADDSLLNNDECRRLFAHVDSLELKPLLNAYTGLLPQKSLNNVQKQFEIQGDMKKLILKNG
jgi:hypothetical protein